MKDKHKKAKASKEIRAIYDDSTVRVYQAYSDQIADEAIAAQSFRAPLEKGLWSKTRMTWIKPSKVWMAYRCGYTMLKDKNQARVLALDIDRTEFEKILLQGQLSGSHESGDNRPSQKCRNCNVVIQWDPERTMDINADPKQVYTSVVPLTRSIQIGLRGNTEALLDPNVVVKITDVTSDFRNALEALKQGNSDQAQTLLWPDGRIERLMEVPNPIRENLGMAHNIVEKK